MTEVFRARIFNQKLVAAPATAVWDVLTDWAGVERLRRPESASGPLSVKETKLVGDKDSTPRTRVFHFNSDLPVVSETLLHQDDELMHLYYNIEGVGPMGIRNYLATTDVDELTDNLCQVTITARFDAPEGVDLVQAKNIINTAHLGVIAGLKYNLEGK